MNSSLPELWRACGVSPPECRAEVEPRVIAVYLLPLNRGSLHAVRPILSEDERIRASKYGREKYGLRFAVSRALLRGVLSLHTGHAPGGLIFHYGLSGRPYLEPSQANGLNFNLARREDCCAIALGFGRRIGVDIESCRSATLIESVKSMLPAKDRAAIATAKDKDRNMRLTAAWTAIEARAKASGTGLVEEAKYDSGLTCRYFELSGGWIGCVAAGDRNLRILPVLQEGYSKWRILDFERLKC